MSNIDQALIAHKREAFDAMRAYHMSEIHHKQHAIDVMKSVLAAVLAFYGGLLVFVSSHALIPCAQILLGVGVPLLVLWFSHSLTKGVLEKIDADHIKYTQHRAAYIHSLNQLDPSNSWDRSAWPTSDSEHKSGHNYTKAILQDFRLLLTAVAIAGSILTFLLPYALTPKSGDKPASCRITQ